MNPVIIIQARLRSTRLPCKVLKDIHGSPMFYQVSKRAYMVAPAILAWPDETPEHDVLARYYREHTKHPEYDPIVRVTSDCPLWDAGLAEHWLACYERYDYDGIGTAPEWDGLDVEIFSAAALRAAHWHAEHPYDREHVTSYMRRRFNWLEIPYVGPRLRFSVDTQEDLDFVRAVYDACECCAEGIPHHTNAATSIGGPDRQPVWDLHVSTGGGLEECLAYDLLKTRMG